VDPKGAGRGVNRAGPIENGRRVVVIGAGIAGLCAAAYARRCGYDVDLVERQDRAGGLATSWRRGGYTFETCLHWLLGSNPRSGTYARWREVLDIDKLSFVQPQEYVRLETDHGESLSMPTDADRLESELLIRAPQDTAEIRRLAADVRFLGGFDMPDPSAPALARCASAIRVLPQLLRMRRWSGSTVRDVGERFRHPLLRSFFQSGELSELSSLALVMSLAWMNAGNARYPIGGSQAVIRLLVERLRQSGARLRFGEPVQRIVVDQHRAVGVDLPGDEFLAADWVISAADGHHTIYELLGGNYLDAAITRAYDRLPVFPSYLQVSLGVARNLSDQPGFVTRLLDNPLPVDPGTEVSQVSFRIFHFDPTFAPPGRTAVTCFLPTRHVEYWRHLQSDEPARYRDEKHRVAQSVIGVLERRLPGIRGDIEVVDVSTPATVVRYTNNWKGSMEGWLPTPATGFRPMRMTLPGLRRFMRVGHWVVPGGGLPSGLMSARAALHEICRVDGR
jgi:phytoene dehydrogenase-like protein